MVGEVRNKFLGIVRVFRVRFTKGTITTIKQEVRFETHRSQLLVDSTFKITVCIQSSKLEHVCTRNCESLAALHLGQLCGALQGPRSCH